MVLLYLLPFFPAPNSIPFIFETSQGLKKVCAFLPFTASMKKKIKLLLAVFLRSSQSKNSSLFTANINLTLFINSETQIP